MKTNPCFSCGGAYADVDGPVHRYMRSSPGCWAAYGEVLAREYGDASFFEVHRLTVDTYAVQHPGSTDRQSIQSVGVHLIRLFLLLECGLPAELANDAMLEAAANKHAYTWLEPPPNLGDITVADVVMAEGVEEHKSLVRSWARCAWDAWSDYHGAIRTWAPSRYGSSVK